MKRLYDDVITSMSKIIDSPIPKESVTDGGTNGGTDGRTDGRTNGRTKGRTGADRPLYRDARKHLKTLVVKENAQNKRVVPLFQLGIKQPIRVLRFCPRTNHSRDPSRDVGEN